LDFDEFSLKVLCLCSPEVVKGLNWALDQSSASRREKIHLVHCTLGTLDETLADSSFDLVYFNCDMGQPIPAEHLRKLGTKAGLASFSHPTPQQLLSLSEVTTWTAISWDGVAFDRLATALDRIILRSSKFLAQNAFSEAFHQWLQIHQEIPDFVEWINPPASYIGPKVFFLDSDYGVLSLGGLKADGTMIVSPFSVPEESCELRYLSGVWSLKVFNRQHKIESSGDLARIRVQDQIEIEGRLLVFRRHSKIEDLKTLARRMDLDLLEPADRQSQARTLADVCRELILSGVKGELRVSSGLKSGAIYFDDAAVLFAVSGSVGGKKGLLRMFSWADPSWHFTIDRTPDVTTVWPRIGLRELNQMHKTWKESWKKIHNLVPPAQVVLKMVPAKFTSRSEWTETEFRVAAAVSEYGRVRDVLNACPLDDSTIIETLIHMRKNGLVELSKS
jgi:hypothetical protein